MTDEKIEARHRAVEACTDYARASGWDNPVVVSYLVICEVVTVEHGRQVTWVGGNGNDPDVEDRAGLMRWQLRGLMSEVEATIVAGTNSNE